MKKKKKERESFFNLHQNKKKIAEQKRLYQVLLRVFDRLNIFFLYYQCGKSISNHINLFPFICNVEQKVNFFPLLLSWFHLLYSTTCVYIMLLPTAAPSIQDTYYINMTIIWCVEMTNSTYYYVHYNHLQNSCSELIFFLFFFFLFFLNDFIQYGLWSSFHIRLNKLM